MLPIKNKFFTLKNSLPWLLLVVSSFFLSACAKDEPDYPKLPALGLDTERTYIAGISSGAYVAHQLHLAWPNEIKGLAAFAGGPYACAEAGVSAALFNCMAVSRGAPKAENSLQKIQQAYKKHQLGDPKLAAQSPVYLYTGAKDSVINPKVSQALAATYAQLETTQLLVHEQPNAGHGLPTLNTGVKCSATQSPYINACDYAGASASLAHLDGALNTAQQEVLLQETAQETPSGALVSFGQAEFKLEKTKSLAEEAFYYVPSKCPAEGCGLLMLLHGCEQGTEFIGQDLIQQGGFLAEAEARGLVVIFPQVKKAMPNPKGCWDWWGYESKNFATRQGAQMQALRSMWLRVQSSVAED